MARALIVFLDWLRAVGVFGFLYFAPSVGEFSVHADPGEQRVAQLLTAAGVDAAAVAGGDTIAVIPGSSVPAAATQTNAPQDPTRPPPTPAPAAAPTAAAVPALPSNRLQSVMVGPHRRLAILDGHEVREGSVVGGSRVVQIQHDAIVLQTGAKRERISLYPNVVRKRRPTLPPAQNRAPRAKHHD